MPTLLLRAAASVRLCCSAHLLAGPSWPSLCASRGGFPGMGGAAAVGPQSAGHEHLLSGDLFLCLSIFLLHSVHILSYSFVLLEVSFGGEQRKRLYVNLCLFLAHYHLPLLCCHVASNFSTTAGSSFLFPACWPASRGCAVATCSNFLPGLCRHLQVACYLVQSVIFHHVIANCCLIISILSLLLSVCLLVSTILCHISISPSKSAASTLACCLC